MQGEREAGASQMQNPDWIGAHTSWVPGLDLEVRGSSEKFLPEMPSLEPRQSGTMWVRQMVEILMAPPLGPRNAGKGKVKSCSRVRLFVTPWTIAHQAPRSMGFSRQEYWSALPFPSPGDLPDPGIEPGSPALRGGYNWGSRQ